MKVWAVLWTLLFILVPVRSWAQTELSNPVATTQESYACPMHAEVTATKPGSCSKCGMALQAVAAAIPDEFVLKMQTSPQRIPVGQKLTLRFSIFHPRTGAQVKQFHIVHEKPFHLFLIRHDFSHFAHLHPIQQADGSFTLETVLPEAGMYHVFGDFSPVGGVAQTAHQTLVTAGFKGEASALEAALKPDSSLTKTVDGMRIALDFAPETPLAGQPALLRYKLTDAATGQPVTDLQPYLGAWGHTLILRADAADYLHSHPLEHDNEVTPQLVKAPANIYFETFFPRPGLYRIWSQFQRQQQLITVSFDVEVHALAENPSVR